MLGAIALGWLTVEAMSQRALASAEAQTERLRAEELEEAVAMHRATAGMLRVPRGNPAAARSI